jgi:hypothetical protein
MNSEARLRDVDWQLRLVLDSIKRLERRAVDCVRRNREKKQKPNA